MHHRTYAVRVDANTCRRLVRLQRGTGTPIRKLVNAVLRDYLDTCAHRARRSPLGRCR
jgi:hypothetical protein